MREREKREREREGDVEKLMSFFSKKTAKINTVVTCTLYKHNLGLTREYAFMGTSRAIRSMEIHERRALSRNLTSDKACVEQNRSTFPLIASWEEIKRRKKKKKKEKKHLSRDSKLIKWLFLSFLYFPILRFYNWNFYLLLYFSLLYRFFWCDSQRYYYILYFRMNSAREKIVPSLVTNIRFLKILGIRILGRDFLF